MSSRKQKARNPRVLVVDDDDSLRMILRTELATDGYLVEEASDGDEAIEHIEHDPLYDLVILDLRMPRVSGLEVLQHIRQNPKTANVRVIVLTGFSNLQMAQRSADAGSDEFIGKPYDYFSLLILIEDLVKK